MHEIHLRGPKKAVYMVYHNLLCCDPPDITHEEGTDDSFVMHFMHYTKYDAYPNEHRWGEADSWDGTPIDLTGIPLEDILANKYTFTYADHDLAAFSGMFGVEIELLHTWDDMGDGEEWENGPVYPFFAYANGKVIRNEELDSDDPEVFSF